jgi:hypothetical protein
MNHDGSHYIAHGRTNIGFMSELTDGSPVCSLDPGERRLDEIRRRYIVDACPYPTKAVVEISAPIVRWRFIAEPGPKPIYNRRSPPIIYRPLGFVLFLGGTQHLHLDK